MRVSLVLFSKYAHLSFKKKLFSLLNVGKCFFFRCFDKLGFTVSYTSLNGNFKRRLILKLLKWHLTAPVFIDLSFFFFWEIKWYINANIVLEILFGYCFYYLSILDNK